ncbi:MAG: PilT/PilU family type 4a pilus ATPase [Elusimicrobiaceae bacterium]|nr:PilT/PilU family type 4a pilus ATPase [Elusimicrobiaceae bacterium]
MAVDLSVLLKTMVEHKASDLHIRSDNPAYIRINGDVKPLEGSRMTAAEVEAVAEACMDSRTRRIFAEQLQVDFSIDGKTYGRFRFNVFRQRSKINISVRHIPNKIPTMESLNLPAEVFKKIAEKERGLVLVTGITGSGKSSTLASMIDHINGSMEKHIITIEDPIEYVHVDKKSILSQREIGADATDFVTALTASMRQDPDVILLGEMRDLETMHAAITAAETGHLVFATVHTLNATQTLSRIVDMFPPHQQTQIRLQLADTLVAIISQRLLAARQGGRIPAIEVLVKTPHIQKLVEENKLSDITMAIQKGAYYGMKTFNQSMVELHQQGLVDLNEILAAASNPDDVMLSVRGIEADVNSTK